VRRAFVPVLLLMLAFCWFLSGVTRIDLNERGVYQRFGVAAAILKPGLHLVLPWPFGIVRHIEYGVLHTVPISYGNQDAGVSDAASAPDTSTAEGAPPASSNRLWDVAQPSDVAYIIASDSAGRQSFETISVSLRVLFRIGLDDDDARRALYRVEDPDALVRRLSGRLLAQFFASRTLSGVLGTDQAAIARQLRTELQQELDRLHSGLDVVAVVVEAIHPPTGAAAAYRNVQAAEIAAATDIATERGRAQTTASVAESAARDATDQAQGTAAATVGAAKVVLRNLQADEAAYRAAGEPFLLERYFANLKSALANSSIAIIDHRLTDPNEPVIDLRPMFGRGDATEGRTP
jgi:regulator of protease activity HflC (stomatin/prohibitin superfamily)